MDELKFLNDLLEGAKNKSKGKSNIDYQLDKLINSYKDDMMEYKRGYEKIEKLEDVMLEKIKNKCINDTYSLASEIFELIDKCRFSIEKDERDLFINYINSKIIIIKNQLSKTHEEEKSKGHISLTKKGELEKYKRYKAIKFLVLPRVNDPNDLEQLKRQQKHEGAFKNYLKNNEYLNHLTLVPSILIYIMLNEKRVGYEKEKKVYKDIIKDNWKFFDLDDLFDFYEDLCNFILENDSILTKNGLEKKYYNEYLSIGYDFFEYLFMGDRYFFILELLDKYEVNLDYELFLYLGIALNLRDIKLSHSSIEKIIKYKSEKNDDKVKSIVYKVLGYKNFVYSYIDYYVNYLVNNKNKIEVSYKNNEFDGKLLLCRLKSLKEKYKSDQELKEYKNIIFTNLKLSEDFLYNKEIIDYIYGEKVEEIKYSKSKKVINSFFNKESKIINLMLERYIWYCKEEKD